MSKQTKQTKKKNVSVSAVTRKFMLNLANTIYDPKTRSFLRLCDGTLQNGPDPTDETRPMHCGLGELYFAMTGLQPNVVGVHEEDVINLAVDLSFGLAKVATVTKAINGIKKLKLPSELEEELLYAVEHDAEDLLTTEAEENFRAVLEGIPDENDDKCGNDCSLVAFRKRSQRVAKELRNAAKFLPE